MATVTFSAAYDLLYAYLTGEIDHDAAQNLRIQLDDALLARTPKTLVLDLGGVGFMDSSGVGLILGRQRCARSLGGTLRIQHAPEQLRNNALTRPYNMVTEMYSLPAYNGLDPNPFVMPFFALFFGIMFADMAYGLILLIAGLLFLWKAKPKGGMKNAAGLLIECGISTFIIGFLTGGFFGDVVSVIGGWFGQDWSALSPAEDSLLTTDRSEKKFRAAS